MMRHPALTACALLLGMGLPPVAEAAPFCMQLGGIPPQCLYADPSSCQREASRNGGRCAVNPAEFKAPVNALPYCLVESGGSASCVFSDYSSCQREVARRGGACIASTPVPPPGPVPAPGEDPYELKRP